MIKVGIFASNNIEKIQVFEEISEYFKKNIEELQYLPNIDVVILASLDAKSLFRIDVLILTNNAQLNSYVAEVGRLCRASIFIYSLNELKLFERYKLSQIGISDFLISSNQQEWLEKIILNKRKEVINKQATLIMVESPKHGLGCTTISAGIAELLSTVGKTVVVDSDFYSQDLSRFLQVKPFVNEILSAILIGHTYLDKELLGDCLSLIWDGEDCYLMTPPVFQLDTPESVDIWKHLLELLMADSKYVVIDGMHYPEVVRDYIRDISDHVITLVSPEPSKLIATIKFSDEKLKHISDKIIYLNNEYFDGLREKELRKHLNFGKFISLPYTSSGSVWMASGETICSAGNRKFLKQFNSLVSLIIGTNLKEEKIIHTVQEKKQEEVVKLLPHFTLPEWK